MANIVFLKKQSQILWSEHKIYSKLQTPNESIIKAVTSTSRVWRLGIHASPSPAPRKMRSLLPVADGGQSNFHGV